MVVMCRSNKINVRADASFIRDNGDGSIARVTAYFHTLPQLVADGHPLNIDSILADLNRQVENWNGRGSGFVIDRVLRFVVCINAYRPLQGSTFIPTPEWLKRKRCIINVENKTDRKCFIWSVLSSLYPPTSHPERISRYIMYQDKLNVKGLEYPVPTKLIPLFEKNNPSIAINVLYPDADSKSKGFHILYRSPHRDRKHVNLLLLDDPENPYKNHYVWVKNMGALVCHRTKHRTRVRMCISDKR